MTDKITIPISPFIWLPCKGCQKITRHVLLNPEDCKEEAIFNCMYVRTCEVGGSKTMISKYFYTLYNGCAIEESDERMFFDK